MKDFIEKFANLFPVTPAEVINEDTEYKYLDDWSSMTTLSLIAMVEDDYDVTLSSTDIRNTDTVGELYKLINKEMR